MHAAGAATAEEEDETQHRSTAAANPSLNLSVRPRVRPRLRCACVVAGTITCTSVRVSALARSLWQKTQQLSLLLWPRGSESSPSPKSPKTRPRHDTTRRHDTTHMQPQPPEPTDVKTCCRPCSLSPHHTASHHTTPHRNKPSIPSPNPHLRFMWARHWRGVHAARTCAVLYCTVLYYWYHVRPIN